MAWFVMFAALVGYVLFCTTKTHNSISLAAWVYALSTPSLFALGARVDPGDREPAEDVQP